MPTTTTEKKTMTFRIEIDHDGNVVGMTGEKGEALQEAHPSPSIDLRDVDLVTVVLGIPKPKHARKYPKPCQEVGQEPSSDEPQPDCPPGQCAVWSYTLRKYICVNCP